MTTATRLSALLLFATLGAVSGLSRPLIAQQTVNGGRAMRETGSIRIHNLVGSTKIVAWDHDSVAVTGTIPRGGGRFDMGGGGGGIKMYVELPPGVPEPAPSHLEIHVPRGARVWVKSASADIEVEGFVRALELNSVGGTIVVRGGSQELRAESMDGSVAAEAGSWTRVKTASGAVTLRGGEDVGIETVTGTVNYRGDAFARLDIETVDGDIWFAGALGRGASLTAESHAGRIDLTLPDTVSAAFTVSNFRGRIDNAFGDRAAQPLPDLRGRAVEFVTRLGAANVTVRNFRGDIVLRRQ